MTNKITQWAQTGVIIASIELRLPKDWLFVGLMARADIDMVADDDDTRWSAIAMRFGDLPLGPLPAITGRGRTAHDAVVALYDQIVPKNEAGEASIGPSPSS